MKTIKDDTIQTLDVCFYGVALTNKANLVAPDPKGLAIFTWHSIANNLKVFLNTQDFKTNVENEVNENFKSVKHRYVVTLHDYKDGDEISDLFNEVHVNALVDVDTNAYYSFSLN